MRRQSVLPCAKDFWYHIEQRGVIPGSTLSPVMIYLREHWDKLSFVLLQRKLLQPFFGLGELSFSINNRYWMPRVTVKCLIKLAYRLKRRDMPIWNAILFTTTFGHTHLRYPKKIGKKYLLKKTETSALQIGYCVTTTCLSHSKKNGRLRFDEDKGVRKRAWAMSYRCDHIHFDDRIKNLSIQ